MEHHWLQLQLKGYNRRRFQNILIPKPLNTSIASDSRTTYVNAPKTTLPCSVPANGRVDLCSVVLVWLGLGHDHDLALKKTNYVCYVQYLTWFNYINWLLYRPLYHLTSSLIFTAADKGLRLTLKGSMSNKLLAQWSYGRFSDEDRLDGLVTAGTLLPFTLPLIFLPGRNITVYIKTTTVPTCCEILLQLLTSDTQKYNCRFSNCIHYFNQDRQKSGT